MELQHILFTQGFGTRRQCAGLVQQGLVAVYPPAGDGAASAVPAIDGAAQFEPHGLRFRVQGADWTYQEKAYLMLHKPAGTECSRRPSAWPSVYSLLPAPLRQRPAAGAVPGVQAVGRLDQDTTGLLLLSDDGQFIHRLSAPRRHVPKVYHAGLKHALSAQQVERLLAGVVLDDDPVPVRASACALLDADGAQRRLQLTLTEGRYHQVKRMLAAVGNRVLDLHRTQIGGLVLPAGLAPGQWRWLTAAEVQSLLGR